MRTSVKLTLMLSVACNTAIAAEGFPAGPARVYPEIGLTFLHNDNILSRSQEEKGSFVTILSPRARLEHKQRANTYGLDFGMDYGHYFSSSDDDYVDVQLGGEADWQIDRRSSFRLNADYLRGHDPRGSTDRGKTDEPDTWDSKGINGLFSYGMPRARIRLEGEAGYVAKRYKDFSRSEKTDDNDQKGLTGRVFYRVLPKTHLFLEADYTVVDYKLAATTLDSDVFGLSLGTEWRATAKTTGRAKLGYLRKAFDSDKHDDFNGVSWQVAVQWKPLSRSTIDIATGRYTTETTGVGDYLLTRDLSVTGTQVFAPRLSGSMGFYLAKTDFPQKIADPRGERSDDTRRFSLSVGYDFLKWASVNGGVNFTDRDSNRDTDDYDQRTIFVTLKAQF